MSTLGLLPNRRQAMVLTAIPVEYQAVRAHLCDIAEVKHHRGTVYEQGRFVCSDGDSWSVGIVEIGAGNAGAAFETERAIDFFNPSVLLFVGVAGGLKDVALCDVVAATKVYGYESGKSKEIFLPRPDVGKSSYSLVQRARVEARTDDWLKRLDCSLYTSLPRVHIAPIAAGEKVVASKRSNTCKFLRTNYSDAVAVEMEGQGFLQTAYANQPVNALIVRGISDLIAGKSKTDSSGYQLLAAKAASAFAFEVISNFERQGNRETGQYVLVFSATIDEVDKERAEAIVAHLREISKDARLTLIEIKEGSVKLLLKGTREGFDRLESLFKSKKLSEELGVEVTDLQWSVTSSERESTHQDLKSIPRRVRIANVVGEATSPGIITYKELIGYRVGDYVIDTFISAGGQAAVYTAHLPQFPRRTYALKIFGLRQPNPTALNVGLNETKKLAAVDHPSVVTFYAPGLDEVQFEGTTYQILYLPMDYAILGSSIKTPPFKDRYLSVLDFRSMIELLDGLQHIHENGFIHEDIKPANILQFQKKTNDEERIVLRIADFGIAKVQSALGVDPADPSGMSPEFMSPEQLDHIHNEKGDIYSMGATLFYMITGRLPIQSPSNRFSDLSSLIRAWQEAHKTQPRPNAMKYSVYCPPRLALLIMRMMSINPNERPDLEECKRELRRIIDTHEQKLFRRLEMPTKLEAELDRDVFPIRYVPEDFRGIFKPKVHEICGTELFIVRIRMGHPIYSQYKDIIEYMVSRHSDCFCLYETWGTYDINILLWDKYDDKEARKLKKDLEQRLPGSYVEIRTASRVHNFHCDNPSVPKNPDPVYALAIQENKTLPDLQRDEYLCKDFDVPTDNIRAFTYVAPVESTIDPYIRKAIVRNVHEILAELMEQDKSSPGAARFRRMSMIELSPPDPSLSRHDATVLIVSFVVSQYEFLASVTTEITERMGGNAVKASNFIGSGRIIIESDKILF